MEKTLVFLKPDAVRRNLIGEIIARFERRGLKVVGLKMMKFTKQLVREHYAHLVDKPFFKEIETFMLSGPVVMMVLAGPNAVNAALLLCGPTDPQKSPPGTIRGDYALLVSENVIHRSDSVEAAHAEITRFFTKEELFE